MVPPRNTTSEEGSRVRFECQAGGYPDNVTVHWSLNGVDVNDVVQLTQPVRRVDVLPDGALIIGQVDKDDTGWYKCRPSNRLGTAPEAEAFLNVTCEYVNTIVVKNVFYDFMFFLIFLQKTRFYVFHYVYVFYKKNIYNTLTWPKEPYDNAYL